MAELPYSSVLVSLGFRGGTEHIGLANGMACVKWSVSFFHCFPVSFP